MVYKGLIFKDLSRKMFSLMCREFKIYRFITYRWYWMGWALAMIDSVLHMRWVTWSLICAECTYSCAYYMCIVRAYCSWMLHAPSRMLYVPPRIFCILFRIFCILFRIFQILSRIFQILSRIFQILSRIFQILSRIFQILSRTFLSFTLYFYLNG